MTNKFVYSNNNPSKKIPIKKKYQYRPISDKSACKKLTLT